MKVVLDIKESKLDFAIEFFKNISFIKKATIIRENEITNPVIKKAIDDYELNKTKATPVNLDELKKMLNA